MGEVGFFTLMLQKSRMLQMQGVKGKAVVGYAEPLTTRLVRSRVNGEMRYTRLSRRVRNMDVFFTFSGWYQQ